jgi:preprotein translocase subunit SecA
MSKIREGVSLRSLEQRSPLNIYVEEAEKRFDILKKNTAHKVVLSIYRLYVPKAQEAIVEKLHENMLLSDHSYNN